MSRISTPATIDAAHFCDRNAALSRAAMIAAALATATVPALAQDADDEINPSPAAIGVDVPATYFGPPPSSVQRELVGPYQTLRSGKIDLEKGTITLPLYEGAMKSGQPVWYIVTDTDDKGNADPLGLNYAPKLTFSDVGRSVRKGTLDSKFKLIFDAGTVDFSPKRSVTPGDAPNFFPPKQFQSRSRSRRAPNRGEGRVLINAIRTTRIWPMVAGSPRYYEPSSAGQ
jgi:hypothetical protein